MSGYKAYLSKDSKLVERTIYLDKRESHHLCRVLRLKKGAEVRVLDGQGKVYETRVEDANSRETVVQINAVRTLEPSPVKVELLLSIPKLKAMDWILKACVEIGIHSIQPLLSDHSAFNLNAKQSAEKMEKWKSSLEESLKQSENLFIPELKPIQNLTSYVNAMDASEIESLNLVASLESETCPLTETLQKEFHEQKHLFLAIGPEGDFSKKEYDLFRSKGFFDVRLSRHILRTESAVFYGLSVLDQWIQNKALK